MTVWKTIVGVFLIVCLVAYVGYIRGSKYASQPDVIKRYAFSGVTVEQKDSDYILTYKDGNEILYWFDINRNRLHRGSVDVIALERRDVDYFSKYFILNDPSILTAVGGVTLGFSLKDIIKNPALILRVRRDLRRTPGRIVGAIASFLATASGYSLGHWYATYQLAVNTTHQEIIEYLKIEKNWVDHERYIFESSVLKLSEYANKIDDNLIIRSMMASLEKEATIVGHERISDNDLLSSDFYRVVKLANIMRPEVTDKIGEKHDYYTELAFAILIIVLLTLLVFYLFLNDARGRRRS